MLDTVIGLPEGLFFGTNIQAVILVFKRNKKNNEVLFIDASHDYEAGNPQNKLRISDIDNILLAYKKHKSVDKYAYLASYEEIKGNDFNLNIPRYIDTFVEEEVIDLKATQKEIASIDRQLSDAQKKMKKYLGELKIND